MHRMMSAPPQVQTAGSHYNRQDRDFLFPRCKPVPKRSPLRIPVPLSGSHTPLCRRLLQARPFHTHNTDRTVSYHSGRSSPPDRSWPVSGVKCAETILWSSLQMSDASVFAFAPYHKIPASPRFLSALHCSWYNPDLFLYRFRPLLLPGSMSPYFLPR